MVLLAVLCCPPPAHRLHRQEDAPRPSRLLGDPFGPGCRTTYRASASRGSALRASIPIAGANGDLAARHRPASSDRQRAPPKPTSIIPLRGSGLSRERSFNPALEICSLPDTPAQADTSTSGQVGNHEARPGHRAEDGTGETALSLTAPCNRRRGRTLRRGRRSLSPGHRHEQERPLRFARTGPFSPRSRPGWRGSSMRRQPGRESRSLEHEPRSKTAA